MNKTILKYELDLNFVLVAITAPLRDYRLCFNVNKELNLDLRRVDDLELINAAEKPFYFSRYYIKNTVNETEFNLLANKGNEGFLIPEMKNADFFLLIHNYIDKEELKEMIRGLNRITGVLVAIEIDPKKLKSKENLIF